MLKIFQKSGSPRDLADVPRQEVRVEVGAVEHARPEVRQEKDEVAVVPGRLLL